ncbi:MAG TPA: cysteine desulfurase [Waddliaceae bacterium]
MPDFLKLREDFPMLKQKMHGNPLIYFDSAATAQKPQAVIDAITQFYKNQYGTVHRAVYQLAQISTQHYQTVRDKIRKFINAKKSEEIIYTRGTTESINMVAYSFGKCFIQRGDEVIISEMEHHSNIVPWQMMCKDHEAILKVIPVNDRGELRLDVYRNLLSEKTKLVAIGHVSNVLGTLNPVKEMIALAHQLNARVLIDGAQAAPHLPVDVQELDADFYAFSGHKILGPTGIGILYGKEFLLEKMPPYQGGGDMVSNVAFEKTTYNKPPLKFEAGTPMIAEVFGLGAAIDYLTSVGLVNIYKREQELLNYATGRLKEIKNLRIVGEAAHKGAIISLIVEGVHPLDIGTLLDLRGIAVRTGHHCAQPLMRRFNLSGTLRLSFGLYNTEKEIDLFMHALQEVLQQLR